MLSSNDYLSAEETEDDEVSGTVSKAKVAIVPENLVPALTDKTFDVVRNENDLMVVDFFQPCKQCMDNLFCFSVNRMCLL